MDEVNKRDQNFVTVLSGVTDDVDQDIRMLRVDPITKRLLVKANLPSSGIQSINADTTSAQTLTTGTTGTDFAIADDGVGDHKFNLPVASATNTGKLSSADWSTFNAKLPATLAQNHFLAGNASNVAVDAGAGITYDGTNLVVAGAISTPFILDSGLNPNIDVDNMQLQIAGATSLDWQNFELTDTLVRSLNWSTRRLYDNGNLISLNWLTRRLIANDGSTVILDWATAASATSSILSLISPVPADKGGTGIANNVASTITINGSFASTFTVTGANTYTFPTATSTLLANNLGLSGGTTLVGGTASGENLTLSTTSDATKGKLLIGSSAYDEVNNRWGIAQTTPLSRLHVNFDGNSSAAQADDRGILLANATAAILNNQSFSPPIVMQGFGWANIVNNSQDVRFRMYVVPIQANNNPTGILRLESSINGLSYAIRFSVTSGGAVAAASFTGNTISTTSHATTLIAALAGGQVGSGFQVISQGVARTTNGGSDLVPEFWAGAPNVTTAGTLAMFMDRSNSLYFSLAASNGTRYITRASMQITNLVNTAGAESADLIFKTQAGGAAMDEKWRIASTGALSNTVAVGTAYIHLKAETATASTGPIKFTTPAALLSAVEAGVLGPSTTGDDLLFTITTGPARKGIVLNDGTNLTSGRIPFATTNGRLTDDADLTFTTDTLTTTKLVISTSLTSVGGTAPVADGTYAVYNDGVTSGQVTSFTTKSGIITAITVIP